jgi:FtsZ-binding cell division protein ZapB
MEKQECKGFDFFDVFDREPLAYKGLTEHQKRCVNELREENQQARNKVMYLELENEELRQYVNALRDKREYLVEQIEERRQEKADLVKTSAAKQSEINQLKSDNDTLRQTAQNLAAWYADAVEENDRLKKTIKQQAEQIKGYIEEKMELRSDKPLTVKIDGVKVNERLKSEMDDLYQYFKELEKEHEHVVSTIRDHIESLTKYNFTDEHGHLLENCFPFWKMAEIVGAEIPNSSPVIYAKVLNDDLVGDLDNVKVKDDLPASSMWVKMIDKRIADAIKEALDKELDK